MSWARVPATSSSMRQAIGWLKEKAMPGKSDIASRILSVSSSRERAEVHSLRGLSMPT